MSWTVTHCNVVWCRAARCKATVRILVCLAGFGGSLSCCVHHLCVSHFHHFLFPGLAPPTLWPISFNILTCYLTVYAPSGTLLLPSVPEPWSDLFIGAWTWLSVSGTPCFLDLLFSPWLGFSAVFLELDFWIVDRLCWTMFWLTERGFGLDLILDSGGAPPSEREVLLQLPPQPDTTLTASWTFN